MASTTEQTLQGGFQFHRGKGAGGKDTLAAVRVVPFFQVILDLLPPVGGIVDIYVRQRSVAKVTKSFEFSIFYQKNVIPIDP